MCPYRRFLYSFRVDVTMNLIGAQTARPLNHYLALTFLMHSEDYERKLDQAHPTTPPLTPMEKERASYLWKNVIQDNVPRAHQEEWRSFLTKATQSDEWLTEGDGVRAERAEPRLRALTEQGQLAWSKAKLQHGSNNRDVIRRRVRKAAVETNGDAYNQGFKWCHCRGAEEKGESRNCSNCRALYHYECLGVTPRKKLVRWYCPECADQDRAPSGKGASRPRKRRKTQEELRTDPGAAVCPRCHWWYVSEKRLGKHTDAQCEKKRKARKKRELKEAQAKTQPAPRQQRKRRKVQGGGSGSLSSQMIRIAEQAAQESKSGKPK